MAGILTRPAGPGAGAARRVAAIHQPNYLPWLGYFDKLLRCDVFVFLDSVQMSVQSYTQRVQVLCQGGPHWLTVPIRKTGLRDQAIRDVRCNPLSPWSKKHIGTLRASYGRHPHFPEIMPDIEHLIEAPPEGLADLNCGLIQTIANRLGVRCQMVRSSELGSSDLRGSELLAALVRAAGAEAYLYGGGAQKYQDEEDFDKQKIRLVEQRFKILSYPQKSVTSFVPGLSIVDALFNMGYEGTREFLSRSAGGGNELGG